MALSPDNRWLATANDDSTVSLFDLKSPGTSPNLLADHMDAVWRVEFSPDSQRLATASFDNSVRLWDIDNPSNASVNLQGHQGIVRDIVFNQDGRSLYTVSMDKTVRIWNITSSQPSSEVLFHLNEISEPDSVSFGAFSATQKRLTISTFEEGFPFFKIYVIDFTDEGANDIVYQRQIPVNNIVMSPDGRWLAIEPQSSVYGFYMWDLKFPSPYLLNYPHWFNSGISFSADSQWMATSGEGIRLWPINLDGLIQAACSYIGRNFTMDEWEHYFFREDYHRTCTNLPPNQ
jgi:WD40 repeat protein